MRRFKVRLEKPYQVENPKDDEDCYVLVVKADAVEVGPSGHALFLEECPEGGLQVTRVMAPDTYSEIFMMPEDVDVQVDEKDAG